MLRQCTGSTKIEGCGSFKLDVEFSNSYKNMCRDCENKRKRDKYHNIEHPNSDSKIFKEVTTMQWRTNYE